LGEYRCLTTRVPHVGGRPSFEPTQAQRQMVEAMAGCGVPEADIAVVIGIAPKTLRKHFRAELDTGYIKATARVAGNLYRIATGSGREAVTAAIFRPEGQSRMAGPPRVRDYPMGKKEARELAVVLLPLEPSRRSCSNETRPDQ
jgi:hypothetical protein